jgi:hypothetical protein
MKNTTATLLIYVAFFSLIGFSVWVTNSAAPLWALLLTDFVPKLVGNLIDDDKKKQKEV